MNDPLDSSPPDPDAPPGKPISPAFTVLLSASPHAMPDAPPDPDPAPLEGGDGTMRRRRGSITSVESVENGESVKVGVKEFSEGKGESGQGGGQKISERSGGQASLIGEGIRADGSVVEDVEAARMLKKYGVERLRKMIGRRVNGEKMVRLAENLALKRKEKGEAYLEAGYEGVNVHVARQGCRRLMEREVPLRALVMGLTEEFLEEMQERYGLEKDRVLREIGGMAFSNIDDVAEWTKEDVTFVPSKDLPRHVKAAIKSVKVKYDKSGGISGREIEMYDKLKAVELAAKHLKLLGEDGTTNEIKVIVQQVSSVEMGPED